MMQVEKLLNRHCDMELMKVAMLKHEETFRQQVHELHRLYRVQKQLMSGGLRGRGPSCRRQRRRHPRRALGLHLPAEGHATPVEGAAGRGRDCYGSGVPSPGRGTAVRQQHQQAPWHDEMVFDQTIKA